MSTTTTYFQKSPKKLMAGRLTYSSFISGCEYIVAKSKSVRDEWQLKASKFDESQKYLLKREVHPWEDQKDIGSNDDDLRDLNSFACDYDAEENDVACKEAPCNIPSYITFEYHIIYSLSYSVPVLYFTATKADGRSLKLEEIWKMVPKSHANALEGKWSFITQTDHPILGHPVFHIHPCNTAKMMENLLTSELKSKSFEYLLMWISALGPLAGLKLPNSFFVIDQT